MCISGNFPGVAKAKVWGPFKPLGCHIPVEVRMEMRVIEWGVGQSPNDSGGDSQGHCKCLIELHFPQDFVFNN